MLQSKETQGGSGFSFCPETCQVCEDNYQLSPKSSLSLKKSLFFFFLYTHTHITSKPWCPHVVIHTNMRFITWIYACHYSNLNFCLRPTWVWNMQWLHGLTARAYQSKSASVQTQGSDSMAPAYFPCMHFRSDFLFLYILFAPMMHASPCKETRISHCWPIDMTFPTPH